MVRRARDAETEEWLQGLSQAYLQCRTYGHDPEPSSVSLVRLKGSRTLYYEQTLVCTHNCGVIWTQLINSRTGEQHKRQPNYSGAPGYLATGLGIGRSDRKNLVRLEDVTRRYASLQEAEADTA